MKTENFRINNEIKERYCTSCNEWKVESDENFYLRNKKKPERGYSSECKVCQRKRSVKDQKLFNQRNPNVKKEYRHNYYLDNKDRAFQQVREWNEENLSRKQNNQKNWQRRNTHKQKKYNEKRANKLHNISEKEWTLCKKYFYFCCAYCGVSEREHKEIHKQQLHKDHADCQGLNDLSNCIPSCKNCNSSKHEYLLEEWYVKQEAFSQERLARIHGWLNEDYKEYLDSRVGDEHNE